MAPKPLLGNPYTGQSIVANAQRAINLYGEKNTNPDLPFPFTWYQTPGSALFAAANNPDAVRCTYRTSIGTAYVVIGSGVYSLASNGALTIIGNIAGSPNQCYISDNGLVAVLVDGSTTGYAIDLNSNAFGVIIDPSFYGADFVVYLDTFFVFNRPNTDQFYISLSVVDFALLTTGTSFDPLDIAAKSGSSDPIVSILTVHQELWLVGTLTTEVWIGTGAADFFFQRVQGAYIQHGCIAKYSAANQDIIAFWLMQDRQGKNVVVQGVGYDVKEISTPRIVKEFNSYSTTADAIGFCFQINDHAFYALIFPTANKSWLYDLTTGFWCEWAFTDNQGQLNRHRANCCMFAFDKIIVGDFSTGQLFYLSVDLFQDNGAPITNIRSFAQLLSDGDRVSYRQFIAMMEVGTIDPATGIDPQVSLSWSDDGGKTFSFPIDQSLGKGGEYLTQASWNRLGMARSRVFQLLWANNCKTCLSGAYVET